jgi:hypothetical protein
MEYTPVQSPELHLLIYCTYITPTRYRHEYMHSHSVLLSVHPNKTPERRVFGAEKV